MMTQLPQQAAYGPEILEACGYLNEAARLRCMQKLSKDLFYLLNASSTNPKLLTDEPIPLGISEQVLQMLRQATEHVVSAQLTYYRQNIMPLIDEAKARLAQQEGQE